MAYSITERIENKYQTGTEITAILDASSDLSDLGTTWLPGSIAIVADKGATTYMLNASHVWKEL